MVSEDQEQDQEILNAREVARRLKVSYRKVVRMAKSGELPSFRVGDLWRFQRGDIEQFIEQQVRKHQ